MVRVQAEKDAPLVKYCGELFPGMKRALDAQHQQYTTWLREAAASVHDKVTALPDLGKPADPKLVASIAEMLDLRFQVAKAQDPSKVCVDLENALLKQTFESLRAEIEDMLSRVLVADDKKVSSP